MPKQRALITGYTITVVACVIGYFATTVTELGRVLALFGFGLIISQVTQKPFLTEFIPRDIIGQISGAYNICMALGRTAALVGCGWMIKMLGNDYRSIWPIAIVFGFIAVVTVATIPDPRYEQHKAARHRERSS